MKRLFVLVGGTGEKPNTDQFLYQWLKASGVMKEDDSAVFVGYPASILFVNTTANPLDIKESSTESRARGVVNLKNTLRRLGDTYDIIVMGYSLGAWVVSDWLDEINALPAHIEAVITFGNPRRKPELGAGGIAGPLESNWSRHHEVSNYYDIVSNTPRYSPLCLLPGVEQLVTSMHTEALRKNWVDFAQLLINSRRLIGYRDALLLRKYADGTGHRDEYFARWAYQHVAAVLS